VYLRRRRVKRALGVDLGAGVVGEGMVVCVAVWWLEDVVEFVFLWERRQQCNAEYYICIVWVNVVCM
jgi:hypothetical protein